MPPQTALGNAINAGATPYVSVHFPVQGRQLDADHGYALYSAITRHLPALHGASWLGIELISGVPWREGIIALPTRDASLRLRIPADHYGQVLPLAGRRLDINGHIIRLGIPAHARYSQPPRSTHVVSRSRSSPNPNPSSTPYAANSTPSALPGHSRCPSTNKAASVGESLPFKANASSASPSLPPTLAV